MNPTELKQATLEYVVRLGDDSLILGHRLSEWTSRGPFLEEDIALGNVALDYIGRARFYYGYAAELKGEGATEDDFAYLRDERQFQNHLILELPVGDFAFTIARQFFVDLFNQGYLKQLTQSSDKQIAGIAQKAVKETAYHLRRSKDWVLRLGDGTDESHQRIQNAIDELWGYTHELFEQDELELNLVELGIAADASSIRDSWEASIKEVFAEATLSVPDAEWAVRGGRKGYHTENLGHVLTELQYVHRAYPGCQW